MLEISCNFMVYINNQSCNQVFSTIVGESKQLSNSSDRNLVYIEMSVYKFFATLQGTLVSLWSSCQKNGIYKFLASLSRSLVSLW